MALPEFSMRQLLEAGAHFGHQTHRWNPKMDRFIFGEKSNIHILDLSQTVPLLHQALMKVREVAAGGGRVLFVGTKRQAADHIKASAQRCAQYFVNSRWLGGTMTNWQTVSKSIARLREVEQIIAGGGVGLTKREVLNLTRERDKLDRSLGGIASMGGVPDIMFVVDTNKEAIAIKEAKKLGIPVVAIIDSNCDPDEVTYPIPGNDDAARAIQLYCDLIADSVLDGLTEAQVREFVTQEAFQGEQLARNMWMRTLTTAPQITTYFLGYDQVKGLYDDVRRARGSRFALRPFMDGMMEMGPVPVAEYRRRMLPARN